MKAGSGTATRFFITEPKLWIFMDTPVLGTSAFDRLTASRQKGLLFVPECAAFRDSKEGPC